VRLVVGVIALSLCVAGTLIHKMVAHSPAEIVEEAYTKQRIDEALRHPPIQTDTTRASFAYKEFRITPRAEYDITGRVFSTRRYYWNFIDRFYKVAPEDLALGWGLLSDYKYRDILHVRQEDRFFKIRWIGAPPLPRDTIISSMSNNHIVPANDDMADKLGEVRPGDIVHMKGALIDISDPGHGTISTSLTRTDTGPGACEIIWLEELEIER
jgi:hypothetical protein